jgi:hypothetical protein
VGGRGDRKAIAHEREPNPSLVLYDVKQVQAAEVSQRRTAVSSKCFQSYYTCSDRLLAIALPPCPFHLFPLLPWRFPSSQLFCVHYTVGYRRPSYSCMLQQAPLYSVLFDFWESPGSQRVAQTRSGKNICTSARKKGIPERHSGTFPHKNAPVFNNQRSRILLRILQCFLRASSPKLSSQNYSYMCDVAWRSVGSDTCLWLRT